MKRLLSIDMTSMSVKSLPWPDKYRYLGGRGLTAEILAEFSDLGAHPYSPGNVIIFAPGYLVEYGIPSSARLSVGSKSPLIQGIKESNAGGITARTLAELPIGAVIISGRARQGLYFLLISPSGTSLTTAQEFAGRGVYETVQTLRDAYGTNTAIALVGPVGELRMPTATIQTTDRCGRPSRACGRGGLGAVLAAKGLKGIIVKRSENQVSRFQELPQQLRQDYRDAVQQDRTTREYHRYGTAKTMDIATAVACLPTGSFRRGTFSQANKIGGKELRKMIQERGGEGTATYGCIEDCLVKCSSIFPAKNGREIVSHLIMRC